MKQPEFDPLDAVMEAALPSLSMTLICVVPCVEIGVLPLKMFSSSISAFLIMSLLKGKRVFLSLRDQRSDERIIGRGALKEFEGFSGNVSFSIARGADEGFKMGLYEPPALFLEAFKKRLEEAGIQVLTTGEKGEAEMVIFLKSL